MNALEKLRSVRYSRTRSELYSERLARLRSAADGLTSQLGGAVGKGSPKVHDRMAELLATIEKMEVKLAYAIVDSEQAAMDAEGILNELPPEQEMVVRLRIIRGMEWEKVAKEMDYSERHCQRFLEVAVGKLVKS